MKNRLLEWKATERSIAMSPNTTWLRRREKWGWFPCYIFLIIYHHHEKISFFSSLFKCLLSLMLSLKQRLSEQPNYKTIVISNNPYSKIFYAGKLFLQKQKVKNIYYLNYFWRSYNLYNIQGIKMKSRFNFRIIQGKKTLVNQKICSFNNLINFSQLIRLCQHISPPLTAPSWSRSRIQFVSRNPL